LKELNAQNIGKYKLMIKNCAKIGAIEVDQALNNPDTGG
jgi:hypothetical protein